MAEEKKRLIRVRKAKNARFRRDGFGKKPQISASWRRPRGLHNKQRRQKKAKGALPTPGFGSPTAVRTMHPSGFFEVMVATPSEIEGIDPATYAIRIAGTVGAKKREQIQELAVRAGIKVLNPRAEKVAEQDTASGAGVTADE